MATVPPDTTPILAALAALRNALLDLTGRNRLLNFKHTKSRSIQFVHSDIDATFKAIVENGARVQIVSLPEPDQSELVQEDDRLRRPANKEFAASRGIDCSHDLVMAVATEAETQAPTPRLQTLFYADELGTRARSVEREARLAIEETGSNMLHLVVGFLEYTDRPGGDAIWLAPLVCVPVAIERAEGVAFPQFHVTATGEELVTNLSLQEKLKRDFGQFTLPEFDPEGNESPTAYLKRVAEAVKDVPRWRVRPMMTLTLLSFSNMLLLRDLEPGRWPGNSLEGHPLVQQLLGGGTERGTAGDNYAPEYAIDDHPRRDLPLVYDADSSQHSALIDVLDGHSRVIEGPPGTGKSQTITTLIAAAISEGKKVLFVAEKLAALKVVKTRLARAGLGNFVLELHSTKLNKKELVAHLAARDAMTAPSVAALDDALDKAEKRHKELRAYADAMNSVLCNAMGLTVHQVLWRAERRRAALKAHAAVVQELECFGATERPAGDFDEATSRLGQVGRLYERIGTYGPEHPFWGFHPTTLQPGDDFKIRQALAGHATKCKAFHEACTQLKRMTSTTKSGVTLPEAGAERLLVALGQLTPPDIDSGAASCLSRFYSADDPAGHGSRAVLQELQQAQAELREAEAACATYLLPGAAPSTADLALTEERRTATNEAGIGGLDADKLVQLADVLDRETTRLQQGVRRFAETATILGVPFHFDAETGRRISAVVELAAQSSSELLAYRHDALERPTAANQLQELVAEHDRLTAERERLEQALYLDDPPPEQDIAAAVRALREGGAWYRHLQPRWRKAIRLHRVVSRNKTHREPAERLAELESLWKLTREQAAWSSDPRLQALAGPHYAGDKTPLGRLLAVAKWHASIHTFATDIGVPVAQLTARETLQALAREQLPLQDAAGEIREASDEIQKALKGLPAQAATRTGTTALERMQNRAIHTAKLCRDVAGILKRQCRDGTPATAGLEAIAAWPMLGLKRDNLCSHAAAQQLLGDAFRGPDTDLGPLFAAHAFGSQVKAERLSPAIESLLLSAECVANHDALTRHISEVKAGWESWREFSDTMTRLGPFSREHWVSTTGSTTSHFARALRNKASRAVRRVSELLPWTQYAAARSHAVELGLDEFVIAMEQKGLPRKQIQNAFAYRFYATIAKAIFASSPLFSRFSSDRHNTVRQEFAALDKEVVQLRGQHVASACIRRAAPPLGTNGTRVSDKTELRLLRYLFPQQQPRVPVRQILDRAGKAIQELTPCFMMGPQAVARFLKPGAMTFDIVVMDEASQLPPAQALGAIARGTQLVVVGDPKQLPPTSFFSAMGADADEVAATDAESILDICLSQFHPTRQLRWHYRSQHPSLIAFSNQEFYDRKLIVFPSPHQTSRSLGVSYHYVEDGIYKDQMNEVEAKRVVDAVVEHILTRPGDSLGVVTLNIKQRDLIEEMLEERLRSRPEAKRFREYWHREGADYFVKNLETVQGDERDCILISTTFGKAPGTTVVHQRFGPITNEGGWRRLNVLFTRARKAIGVYSSMRPEDIVSDAAKSLGPRSLRKYLEFARDGLIRQDHQTDRPPESDFEVAVIAALRRHDYNVTPQLGVAGFRIDIAVKHPHAPGGYLAAIECDGASYHSGVSVRDRDRIRQEILESLGWRGRIWRIWSTDWFRNPRGEANRLLAFLDRLKQEPLASEAPPPSAVELAGAHDDSSVAGSLATTSAMQRLLFDDEESVATDAMDDEMDMRPPDSPEEELPPRAKEEDLVGSEHDSLDISDDEEQLIVAAGDDVVIVRVDRPQARPRLVKVDDEVTDLRKRVVSLNDAYGTALIGALVGEHVTVKSEGTNPKTYVVKEIRRT